VRRTPLHLTLAVVVLAAGQGTVTPPTAATLAPRSRSSAQLVAGEQLDQENLSANTGAGTGSIDFGQSFRVVVAGLPFRASPCAAADAAGMSGLGMARRRRCTSSRAHRDRPSADVPTADVPTKEIRR
jgi:hypothetical protein